MKGVLKRGGSEGGVGEGGRNNIEKSRRRDGEKGDEKRRRDVRIQG